MLWQLDRTLFIVSIFHSFFSSCVPFIEIQLSAYVLDQLHSGLDFQPFIRSILLVLTGICLLNIGIAYLKKVMDVQTSLCGQKFDMLMGIRTLTMDYELLEAPTVNQIRSKIQRDSDWGAGFYSVIWQFPTMMTKFFHLLFSIIILVPLFTESTLFRDYSALLILILTMSLVIFHVIYSGNL